MTTLWIQTLYRLSDELATALQYKEAHADLLSEVISLIQRNELAEAEAERLSRFNAEVCFNYMDTVIESN